MQENRIPPTFVPEAATTAAPAASDAGGLTHASLKAKLYQHIRDRGVLRSLKGTLRKELLGAVPDLVPLRPQIENGAAASTEATGIAAPSAATDSLCDAIIENYLRNRDLSATRTVFVGESGVSAAAGGSGNKAADLDLCSLLRMPAAAANEKDTILASLVRVFMQYAGAADGSGSGGALVLARPYPMSDAGVQCSLPTAHEAAAFESIEYKLSQVDQGFIRSSQLEENTSRLAGELRFTQMRKDVHAECQREARHALDKWKSQEEELIRRDERARSASHVAQRAKEFDALEKKLRHDCELETAKADAVKRRADLDALRLEEERNDLRKAVYLRGQTQQGVEREVESLRAQLRDAQSRAANLDTQVEHLTRQADLHKVSELRRLDLKEREVADLLAQLHEQQDKMAQLRFESRTLAAECAHSLDEAARAHVLQRGRETMAKVSRDKPAASPAVAAAMMHVDPNEVSHRSAGRVRAASASMPSAAAAAAAPAVVERPSSASGRRASASGRAAAAASPSITATAPPPPAAAPLHHAATVRLPAATATTTTPSASSSRRSSHAQQPRHDREAHLGVPAALDVHHLHHVKQHPAHPHEHDHEHEHDHDHEVESHRSAASSRRTSRSATPLIKSPASSHHSSNNGDSASPLSLTSERRHSHRERSHRDSDNGEDDDQQMAKKLAAAAEAQRKADEEAAAATAAALKKKQDDEAAAALKEMQDEEAAAAAAAAAALKKKQQEEEEAKKKQQEEEEAAAAAAAAAAALKKKQQEEQDAAEQERIRQQQQKEKEEQEALELKRECFNICDADAVKGASDITDVEDREWRTLMWQHDRDETLIRARNAKPDDDAVTVPPPVVLKRDSDSSDYDSDHDVNIFGKNSDDDDDDW